MEDTILTPLSIVRGVVFLFGWFGASEFAATIFKHKGETYIKRMKLVFCTVFLGLWFLAMGDTLKF